MGCAGCVPTCNTFVGVYSCSGKRTISFHNRMLLSPSASEHSCERISRDSTDARSLGQQFISCYVFHFAASNFGTLPRKGPHKDAPIWQEIKSQFSESEIEDHVVRWVVRKHVRLHHEHYCLCWDLQGHGLQEECRGVFVFAGNRWLLLLCDLNCVRSF